MPGLGGTHTRVVCLKATLGFRKTPEETQSP